MIRSSVPEGFNNRKIGGSKMAKDFIKKATSKHPGLFKKKAEAAGMSTAAYAEKEKNAGGTLGKEAVLAKTLMSLSKKKKK